MYKQHVTLTATAGGIAIAAENGKAEVNAILDAETAVDVDAATTATVAAIVGDATAEITIDGADVETTGAIEGKTVAIAASTGDAAVKETVTAHGEDDGDKAALTIAAGKDAKVEAKLAADAAEKEYLM